MCYRWPPHSTVASLRMSFRYIRLILSPGSPLWGRFLWVCMLCESAVLQLIRSYTHSPLGTGGSRLHQRLHHGNCWGGNALLLHFSGFQSQFLRNVFIFWLINALTSVGFVWHCAYFLEELNVASHNDWNPPTNSLYMRNNRLSMWAFGYNLYFAVKSSFNSLEEIKQAYFSLL